MFGGLVAKIAGSVLGSIVGNLISGLFSWWRDRRAINDAKQQGRTEQANVELRAAAEASKESQDVENRIAAASDDQRDGLRRKWTRPADGS